MTTEKKTIIIVGPPGSGKTVALETLNGGTILFNFDEGGWKSLRRPPIPESDKQLILQGKKKGRIPKKLIFSPTLELWLKGSSILQPDEILVIDYREKPAQINIGLSTFHKTDDFLYSSKDINLLASLKDPSSRGICHACVDSLTGWAQAIHDAVITFRGPTKGGYVGADQDTYGKAIDKVVECIQTCYRLSINFILTAHLSFDKDIGGAVFQELAVYGRSLPNTIVSKTDDIYLAANNDGNYTWSAHPDGFIKALRARSFDNLPKTFPANFQQLYGDQLPCRGSK